jgi:zinc transport system substrate-binding protein
MRKAILLFFLSLLIWNCGDSKAGDSIDSTKDLLAVSVLPQKLFLQKIVGDRYDIHVMIPPGYSPATFAPTPLQVQELGRAKLYFRIGHIGFETAWMGKIAELHPNLTMVDTSSGVPLIHADHTHHHDGDEEQNEAEGGIDPHIWLSPAAVKIQAANMLTALTELDPASSEIFQENYNQFVNEVDQLDVDIRTILREIENRKFLVFHPAWSYFARDFSMEQHPIEFEGKEPNPSGLKDIVKWAKSEGVRVIFVQRQFDTNSALAIAEDLDGEVVTMDPLAENWFANMRDIALTLKRHLGPEAGK